MKEKYLLLKRLVHKANEKAKRGARCYLCAQGDLMRDSENMFKDSKSGLNCLENAGSNGILMFLGS